MIRNKQHEKKTERYFLRIFFISIVMLMILISLPVMFSEENTTGDATEETAGETTNDASDTITDTPPDTTDSPETPVVSTNDSGDGNTDNTNNVNMTENNNETVVGSVVDINNTGANDSNNESVTGSETGVDTNTISETETEQTIQENTTLVKTKKPWSERCVLTKKNLDKKVNKYINERSGKIKQFSKLTLTFEKVIVKADKKLLNTTSAKEHKIILDDRILRFTEEYDILIEDLKKADSLCCTNQKEYAKAYSEVKTQLKILKNDAESIKSFYKNEIKTDVKDLRDEEKAMKLAKAESKVKDKEKDNGGEK